MNICFLVTGDVDGSVEAILDAFATYDCQHQCKMEVLSYGVGIISDKDIELADTFSGTVYCKIVSMSQCVAELSF